ncbi:hypothetical protein H8E06_00920 [bacterium]|nr:hypothetical protein [bacterium]
MAVKNPDFRVKHGLRVGGTSTLAGGLSCLDDATFDKNLRVNGNLIVDGDTTTLNTTAIEVEDPLLSLGASNTTDTLDIGFYGQYQTGATLKYAGLFRDATDGIFKLFSEQQTDPTSGNIDTTGTIARATLSANLDGNSSTATKWANLVNISFASNCDLLGSVSFDGSSSTVSWEANLRAGSVDTTALGDLAVTNAKLAHNSVDSDVISAGAVTNAKIGTGAVDSAQLAGAAVTTAKIGAGAVLTSNIGTGAVTTDKIGDLQTTTAKIAASAVTEDKLAADCINNDHIQDGAVDLSKLGTGAVTTAKIAASAVTSDKLGADAVLNDHIAANAVEAQHISNNAIQTAMIVDSTGTSDGITTAKIATSAVTSAKIAAAAVTNDHLATNAVESAAIKANAVTNAKILNDYISINGVSVTLGNDITVEGLSSVIDTASINLHIEGDAGNAVLSADVRIADNSLETTTTGLTGLRIKALGVEASHLAADAVETAKIKDLNVTTAKLANGAVTDSKIALDHGQFVTLSGNCLSGAEVAFDTTTANDYRAINYFVQGNVGSDYQSSYVTLLHNGTDVWIMEHGIVHTTDDTFMVYDAYLSGGNVGFIAKHNHSNGDATGAVKALKQAIKTGDTNP